MKRLDTIGALIFGLAILGSVLSMNHAEGQGVRQNIRPARTPTAVYRLADTVTSELLVQAFSDVMNEINAGRDLIYEAQRAELLVQFVDAWCDGDSTLVSIPEAYDDTSYGVSGLPDKIDQVGLRVVVVSTRKIDATSFMVYNELSGPDHEDSTVWHFNLIGRRARSE